MKSERKMGDGMGRAVSSFKRGNERESSKKRRGGSGGGNANGNDDGTDSSDTSSETEGHVSKDTIQTIDLGNEIERGEVSKLIGDGEGRKTVDLDDTIDAGAENDENAGNEDANNPFSRGHDSVFFHDGKVQSDEMS